MIPARPYANSSLPSVTTVIEELSTPGLSWAAARETARFAVYHPNEWMHLSDEQAIDRLYRHHRGVWDGKAATGTLLHRIAAHLADGSQLSPTEVEAAVRTAMDHTKDARSWWKEPFDKTVERVLGYVNGLETFWADQNPSSCESEVVVRYPDVYIGTADLCATIGGVRTLVDLKTTAQQTQSKGIYADSWALQLHAYAYATERVNYDVVDGDVVEVSTTAWDQPDRLCILHLRGDTGYTLREIPKSDDVFQHFLRLCQIHEWRKHPAGARIIARGAIL